MYASYNSSTLSDYSLFNFMDNQPTVIEKDSSFSALNTLLIVIVLVLIVGFGVWWYKTYASPAEPTPQQGLQINVDANGGSTGQTVPTGSQTPSNPQNY